MNKFADSLYDYNPVDDSYVIKLAANEYVDIFNNLDHYPIRKRDIDNHVIHYIEDCSSDIPLKKKINIEIKIKNQTRDPDLENRTQKGIHTYFISMLYVHKKKSKSVINTSFLYTIMFLILTTLTFSIEALNIEFNTMLLKTILVGLSIGSWVFLWEAIAGIVIKNQENRFMIKTYKRLSGCHLFFVYE